MLLNQHLKRKTEGDPNVVKLKGPLQSASANAAFADILTYSDNHKRQSARKKTKPKITRTPKQISIRLMISFLAKQWALLTPAQMETWGPLAQETNIAHYHAYLSYNMRRWRAWRPPSKAFRADEAATPPTTIKPWRYPQWHAYKIQIYSAGDANTWAYAVHSNPHPAFNPSFENLNMITPNIPAADEFPYFAPVDPPSTHVKIRPFGFTGVWGNIPNALFVPITA